MTCNSRRPHYPFTPQNPSSLSFFFVRGLCSFSLISFFAIESHGVLVNTVRAIYPLGAGTPPYSIAALAFSFITAIRSLSRQDFPFALKLDIAPPPSGLTHAQNTGTASQGNTSKV